MNTNAVGMTDIDFLAFIPVYLNSKNELGLHYVSSYIANQISV